MHSVAGSEPPVPALVQKVACIKHNAPLTVQYIQLERRINHVVFDHLPLSHDTRSPVIKPGLHRKYRSEPVIGHHVAIPAETFRFFDIERLTALEDRKSD